MADFSSGQSGHVTEHNRSRIQLGNLVRLDSFDGADDNAKLSAAMSYAGAQTYTPLIGLECRAHSLSGALGQPYDGFGLVGAGRGWLNAEQGVKHTQVTLTVSGSWLTLSSGTAWNWYFEGINFVGGGTSTQFLRSPSGQVLWAFTGHNLTFQNFHGVLGNSSESCNTDLISCSGKWVVLSCLDTPFNIAGADNRELWGDGMNIGSGDQPTGGAGNKFLMMFKSCSKSTVGPIYLTADNGWRGVLCTGSKSAGYGLTFRGMVSEGRNAGDPCGGNLVRVEGGAVTLRDFNVNCGMASPSGTSTSNPNGINDRGLIEVVGSDTQVNIECPTFTHATGVAVTTPCVYVDGSIGAVDVRVSGAMRGTRSGSPSWGSQLPVVKQSTTGLVTVSDATVALSVG